MKNQDISKWIRALLSGEYSQGQGALCYEEDGKFKYCCLGVMIHELYEGYWEASEENGFWTIGGDDALPSNRILENLGLESEVARHLARMNDRGESFESIAKWLDYNRELLIG